MHTYIFFEFRSKQYKSNVNMRLYMARAAFVVLLHKQYRIGKMRNMGEIQRIKAKRGEKYKISNII